MTNERNKFFAYLATRVDEKPLQAILACFVFSLLSLYRLPVLWISMVISAYSFYKNHTLTAFFQIGATLLPFLILSMPDFMSVLSILLIIPMCMIQSKFKSFNITLEIQIIIAIFVIILLHILFPNLKEWWTGQFSALYDALLKDGMYTKEQVEAIVNTLSSTSTGLITFSLVLNLFLVNFLSLAWIDTTLSKTEHIDDILFLKLGIISPIMLILFSLQFFLVYNWTYDIAAFIGGVMIMYGFLIIMGIAWQVFQTHAWLLITFFVLSFLMFTSFVMKYFMLLLAFTDYFANWRTIFESRNQPNSKDK